MDGERRSKPLRPARGRRVSRRRFVAPRVEGACRRRTGGRVAGRVEGGVRLHRTGKPVGRDGRDPLRERAGGPGGARPLRCPAPGRQGRVVARRHVRAFRRRRRPGRSAVEAAGHLCPRMRAHRPLVEPRDPARRRARTQPRGDRGRPCGGCVQSGGRVALRRRAGGADRGGSGRRGNGRGLRARIAGDGDGGRAQCGVRRGRRERRGRQRGAPGGQRSVGSARGA